MQAEDWGRYSQAPWMTGGAWKATNVSARSKKTKPKKQPAPPPTPKHACDFSAEATSTQDEEDRFRAEVDRADHQLKLRRWNFARSWKRASSGPLGDECSPLSPRSREAAGVGVGGPVIHSRDEAAVSGDRGEKEDRVVEREVFAALSSCHRVDPIIGNADPSLDRGLMGQYLDRCIAATESQLVEGRKRSKKQGAVREIERLVEKVIATQAGLASERV
ncbi:MAG: hypothetical protein Q9161_008956 [Pseudevernia consocians]